MNTMDFYTYIIFSPAANLYYAGITNNLKNRLKEHNKGKSKTTARADDWELIYSKCFTSRIDAYEHELYIKGIGPKRFVESV